METKQCLYCKDYFSEDAFGVALTTPTKVFRRRKCRDCYRETKLKLANGYHKWLSDIKQERGCKRCGITDSRVLDFHHRGDEVKHFSIGYFRRAVGFDRIQREVKKCDVLCSNCHRMVHDEQRKEKRGIVYR
jgi:hypothetical protein